MEATIEGKTLVIRIPMQSPQRSKGGMGKTLIVATSHGNQTTSAIVDGQPVVIGLNAYIYPKG